MFRNPPQLALLARLLRSRPAPWGVRVYGVADGAEAVSLLITVDPDAGDGLLIEGYDIDQAHLAAAADLCFAPEQFAPDVAPASHPRHLRSVGGAWCLRDEWRPMVRIEPGDLRGAGERAQVDLVMCQNTLVSFADDDARAAVVGLAAEVAPGGWLAVGGGSLDVVPAAVSAVGFEPELADVAPIHESWAVQRSFWANRNRPYWALEPFDADHPDGPVRFCTVFRRPVGSGR